ncbi:hypothetical protein KDD30_20485 (plasmid) [Photobacterium sp. GJ3]|nr:hypothetical protein KDD30_20485 [Photobacterium sp. GJ3]
MSPSVYGIDLAKHRFSIHGEDHQGKLLIHKSISRQQLSGGKPAEPLITGPENWRSSAIRHRSWRGSMWHLQYQTSSTHSDVLLCSVTLFLKARINDFLLKEYPKSGDHCMGQENSCHPKFYVVQWHFMGCKISMI